MGVNVIFRIAAVGILVSVLCQVLKHSGREEQAFLTSVMSVLTIGILGIAGALLAVELKGLKGEYGIYLVAAVGLVIFFYGITKLKTVIETIRQVQSYIRLNRMYLEVLLKMIGITYIAEFSSGICKDAGYGSLGSQIEIFGKLSVLAVSMPILLALLDTVQQFLA